MAKKMTAVLKALVVDMDDENALVMKTLMDQYITPWSQARLITTDIYNRANVEYNFLQKNRDSLAHRRVSLEIKTQPDPIQEEETINKKQETGSEPSAHAKRQQPPQRKPPPPPIARRPSHEAILDANIQVEKKLKDHTPQPAKQNHSAEIKKNMPDGGLQEIQRLRREREEVEAELAAANSRINSLQRDLDELKSQLGRKNIEVEKLSKERNDFQLRLSKLAGAKMTDGNAGIADLSDPNRPTELGARFGDLYDNECSDALEELTTACNVADDSAMKKLVELVQEAYAYCDMLVKKQLQDIRNMLIDPSFEGNPKSSKHLGDTLTAKEMEITKDELYVALKTFKKKYGNRTAQLVAKRFATEEVDLSDITGKKVPDAVTTYARRCAEVCWHMVITVPPVVIYLPAAGDAFDMNHFRPYTRSTKDLRCPVVEFGLWPCLLLHRQGPLLAKGVCQPIEKEARAAGPLKKGGRGPTKF